MQTKEGLLACPEEDDSTIRVMINSYGIILMSSHPFLVGQPLMRFIHNDDLLSFCTSLGYEPIITLRCNFSRAPTDFETLYQLTATTTITRDITCVIRPLPPPSFSFRSVLHHMRHLAWSTAEHYGLLPSSFWIKASALAWHCLLAETQSHSWLSWLSPLSS